MTSNPITDAFSAEPPRAEPPPWPLDQWYVAGHASELSDKPLARTLLDVPVVMFRSSGGVTALEDRCAHRHLPLSFGTLEDGGIRCGYHGLLYGADGVCIEVPGQALVPRRACVRRFPLREQDRLLWVWAGAAPDSPPTHEPPRYPFHDDPQFRFGSGLIHYEAPYALVHDNLLDLSHLGYVHVHTIGGNAGVHTGAQMQVSQAGDVVSVVRRLSDSVPPPTYTQAWPFKGRVDRWQEIEFHLSHLRIWSGAVDAGSESLDDPERGGFHMRGFHGVTPETRISTHYLWTIANRLHPAMPDTTALVIEQTRVTFDEDKLVIEAQFRNMQRFGHPQDVGIAVDAAPTRARRIVERFRQTPASISAAPP